ncbi:conserved hypothetical protein [Ricinus communis]|uniref:Uncharacterized protein n=1 Tax=Ricinus communis TaxID=3988 RepID=B9TGN1_RICCO|nr:conserved hypothetical protein [Ricinus communis]
MSGRAVEAIQPCGVVHQDAVHGLVRARPGLEQIDQVGIVDGARRLGGVRPVAAPDQALGCGAHQVAAQRQRVGIGRAAHR